MQIQLFENVNNPTELKIKSSAQVKLVFLKNVIGSWSWNVLWLITENHVFIIFKKVWS